jgi:DNA repair protein RadC
VTLKSHIEPGEFASMSDAHVLSAVLSVSEQANTSRCEAQTWLTNCGGIGGLFRSRPGAKTPLPTPVANCLGAAQELVMRSLRASLTRGISLTNPGESADYLNAVLRDRSREVFSCLFLDTRHRVIAFEELFQGSIDGACVYPRVVAERALQLGSAAVIVAHNHPSGVTEPSLSDQAITHRLRDALALLDIRLLDHFVVGDGRPVSMAERGMV